MPMDVVVAKANSDQEREGGHTRVSGVQGRVYCGDVLVASGPVVGSFSAGGDMQLRKETSFFSEAEVEQEPLVTRSSDGSGRMPGFQAGDMVWGKVKSHPWWPGYIFHESFCPSSVLRTKRDGHVLVAFFGDNSYGWFDPAELLPFDQHFGDKSKQSTSKNFLDAVCDAVGEVSRRGALGLSCCCHKPDNFRKATAPGYFVVDILGHENNVVYSKSVIDNARNSFIPVNVMAFVSKLSVAPCEVDVEDVDAVKMVAILEAFRKANNGGFVGTTAQAPGLEPAIPQSVPQGILQHSTFREPRGCIYSLHLQNRHLECLSRGRGGEAYVIIDRWKGPTLPNVGLMFHYSGKCYSSTSPLTRSSL